MATYTSAVTTHDHAPQRITVLGGCCAHAPQLRTLRKLRVVFKSIISFTPRPPGTARALTATSALPAVSDLACSALPLVACSGLTTPQTAKLVTDRKTLCQSSPCPSGHMACSLALLRPLLQCCLLGELTLTASFETAASPPTAKDPCRLLGLVAVCT